MTRSWIMGMLAIALLVMATHALRPLELGAHSARRPTPEFLEKLRATDEPVLVEWYRTAPAELDGVRRAAAQDVEAFLLALQAEGVRVRSIEPATNPAEQQRAAALGLSAVRTRTLESDGWREQELWSALRLAVGARGATVLPYLDAQRTQHLPELLEAQFDNLLSPRRARVGLSAPPGHRQLRALLEASAEVVEVDFDAEPLPQQPLDMLVVVAPTQASPEHVAALELLQQRGTDLALFLAADSTGIAQALQVELGPTFGSPQQLVRSLPQDQDFRTLVAAPNGPLVFAQARSVHAATESLEALERDAQLLASASTREPLLVQLSARDPWRGRVWVCGDASVVHDRWIALESTANENLIKVLLATSSSPERLATRAAARLQGAVHVSPQAQTLWWLVVLAPVVLLGIWYASRSLRAARIGSVPSTGVRVVLALGLALALGAVTQVLPSTASQLPAQLVEVVRRLPAGVRVELASDDSAALPPDVRAAWPRAAELVEALRPQGVDVHLTSAEQSTHALGWQQRSTRDGAGTRVWRFRCAVTVTGPHDRVTLPLSDTLDMERLAFRLALALARCGGLVNATVGTVSAPVRLTPAEARRLYEARGRFAPGGSDRYSAAREVLQRHGFEVRTLREEAPDLSGVQLLVVLQPRRDSQPALQAAQQHLQAGLPVLLCAQELQVVPRAREESGLQQALWPRPLYADVDAAWLRAWGLTLDPAILVDQQHGTLEVDAWTERGDEISGSRAVLASPIVPALTARWTEEAPARRLDALSPNAWRVATQPLQAAGLTARAVLTTSPAAHSIAWRGGDLASTDLTPSPRDAAATVAWYIENTAASVPATRLLVCGASAPFQDEHLWSGADDSSLLWLEWVTRLTLGDEWVPLLHDTSIARIGSTEPHSRFLWRIAVIALPVLLALTGIWWLRRRRKEPAGLALLLLGCGMSFALSSCQPALPESSLQPLCEARLLEGKPVAAISARLGEQEWLWYRSKGEWRSREAFGALCDRAAVEAWLARLVQAQGAVLVSSEAETALTSEQLGQLGFTSPLRITLHGSGLTKREDRDALLSIELGQAQTPTIAPPNGRTLVRRTPGSGPDQVLEIPYDARGPLAPDADLLAAFVDRSLLAGCTGPGFAGFQRYVVQRPDGSRLTINSQAAATPDGARTWTIEDGQSTVEALPWRAGGYGSLWILAEAERYAPTARAAELGLESPIATIELLDSTNTTTRIAIGSLQGGLRWLRNERTGLVMAVSSTLDNQLMPVRDDFLPSRVDNPWERWLAR